MRYQTGLMLSEVVTLIMLVLIAAGVAFGLYVSSQRNAMVELAQESLASIKAIVEVAEKKSELIPCTNALVPAEVIQNEFLELNIKPMLVTPGDFSAGYGVGVYVSSHLEDDGSNTFVTAERLQEVLLEDDKYIVRPSLQSEDDIAYSILLSETAICAG